MYSVCRRARIHASCETQSRLGSHLADAARCTFVEVRQALLWSGLLLGSQATDTLTTAIDRARGAVEMMPISSRLLEVGGVALFWTFKVMVAAAAGPRPARSLRRCSRDRASANLPDASGRTVARALRRYFCDVVLPLVLRGYCDALVFNDETYKFLRRRLGQSLDGLWLEPHASALLLLTKGSWCLATARFRRDSCSSCDWRS